MKHVERARKRTDVERRLKQADRTARVLRILQMLSGRARWNVKDLAAELECSERTIHRDLLVLQMAGIRTEFDKQASCYRIDPSYRLPVLNLTEEELLGQAVATAASQAAGLKIGVGAKPTTRKLAEASSEDAAQILTDAEKLVTVLDLKLADHSRHLEIIRTMQWALLKKKQVTGTYLTPYAEKPVSLRLHPYRLALVKQAWYVIARPTDAEQPRTYRVSRFKTLRLTNAAAETPDDFDLRTYFGHAWSVYRGKQTYDVVIVFTKEAAPLVTETTWHHSQQVRKNRDGSILLTFRVDGLEEILWWVLGWTGRAKVLNPPELRSMLLKQLREAIVVNENAEVPGNP